MAILDQPHWETVDPTMRGLLRHIGQQPFVQRFYLAGGTALALQIGHRRSVDLDFFSETDEVKPDTHQQILHALKELNPRVVEEAFGNFVLSIDRISVGFFGYGYPLIGETLSVERVPLASIEDIGLMKLDALISRGNRKDFYDVFFIAQQVALSHLLRLGKTKYPMFRDFPSLALKHLILFDNADRDFQPDLFMVVEWENVKNFFVEQAKRLSREFFGY